jgi:hypothetical protein
MKRYRYTELRYVPNLLEDRTIVVGIILWHPGTDFVRSCKRTDWSAVSRLDPDSDIEFLAAAVDHIEQQFRQTNEAERERLLDQLSMNLTFSDPQEIETDDPVATLTRFATTHLGSAQ